MGRGDDAMPMGEALRLCPDLIVVRTSMSKYKAVSAEVHEIFRDYTELVEPLSLVAPRHSP